MSNKLICPFCGEELEDAGIHSAEFYFWCTNCYMKQKEKDDNYTASPRIWQALIQAKQDLEIATKALREIRYCKSAGFDLPAQNPWEIIADKALKTIGTHNE